MDIYTTIMGEGRKKHKGKKVQFTGKCVLPCQI